MDAPTAAGLVRTRVYRAVWRWHFYAGLFCIPFVLWLATTGSIYLFKPQFEAWQDRGYDALPFDGAPARVQDQVRAALAAVPGSTLNGYELVPGAHDAARVIVGRGAETYRVYVHPATLAILKVRDEDDRFMNVVHELHGRLLLGDAGSMLVELAASWAIVMIVSGLYLWWPRGRGLAGVLWPRLTATGRPFWRDLHAVVGFWVSACALFLLITALPWTHLWGGNLKTVRQLLAPPAAKVATDWSTGRSSDLADRRAMNRQGADAPAEGDAYAPLDRLVATVAPLELAPPVRVQPPSAKNPRWTAESLSQNRPLRAKLTLDPDTGAVLSRSGFADKKLLDRMIGVGIAAHEGQLFGALNQALGLFTACGLILLSVSGLTMWFGRRPAGTLGAPAPMPEARLPRTAWAGLAVLAIALPLLGATAIAALVFERTVLRRIAPVRDFLGLAAATSRGG